MSRALLTAVWLAGVGLFAAAPVTRAAPVPPAKPAADKWEYAEVVARPGGPGGPGGASLRWVTADEVVEGTSWDDLGTKLKAPAAAKDADSATHKLRVLTHIGGEGWELVTFDRPEARGNSTWLFKRKVPAK